MADKEVRRLALARRASALLRDDPEFRESLTYVAPDGSRPILVAMLDDRVGLIFDRISSVYPAGANVVVGGDTGRMLVIAVRQESVGMPRFGTLPGDCPIHIDSEIGMMVAYLLVRASSVRFMPTVPTEQVVKPDYEIQLEKVPA